MSIFIDAVFIGLIFLRFSRPQKRSSSLVFSPLACVRRETDAVTGAVTGLVLEVRLAELRRYELIEARVRVYALRHERTPRAEEEGAILFQSQQLELSSPPTTSGQGAFLLMYVSPSQAHHKPIEYLPDSPVSLSLCLPTGRCPPRWCTASTAARLSCLPPPGARPLRGC
jgi:hypothetical protein